jgi:quercetin dioxygenase-like cupin family protein
LEVRVPLIHAKDIAVKSPQDGLEMRSILDSHNGSQTITLVNETLHAKGQIPAQRHKVETTFFVNAGAGLIEVDGEERYRIEAGACVLVPANSWYSIENDGEADLKYMMIHPAVDVATEIRGKEKPCPTVFRAKDMEPKEILPGVFMIRAIEHANGSPMATMGYVTIQPGHEVPPHVHPTDDAMVIISGKGEVYTEGDNIPIEAGDHLWAPANERHGVKNVGDEPLVLVYTWPAVNVSRVMTD